MDMFQDNPMLSGVRQMLGAFAQKMMRPVAELHDREESMPWDLMKTSQQFGMTQTSVLDGRKKLTGVDEDPDPKKPKSQARLSVALTATCAELRQHAKGLARSLSSIPLEMIVEHLKAFDADRRESICREILGEEAEGSILG